MVVISKSIKDPDDILQRGTLRIKGFNPFMPVGAEKGLIFMELTLQLKHILENTRSETVTEIQINNSPSDLLWSNALFNFFFLQKYNKSRRSLSRMYPGMKVLNSYSHRDS